MRHLEIAKFVVQSAGLLMAAAPGLLLSEGLEIQEGKTYRRDLDPHGFRVFHEHGGWCWFQDPRAIIHEGQLFIGSVRGNGNGEALVGVYDLEKDEALGAVVLHPEFDRDDHNSPVFYARPDNRVLAVYARHGDEPFHHSRISTAGHPLQWSEETLHERVMTNPKDKVTYMNLYEMSEEDRLYLFFRGIEYNPTFVVSSDHGETWGEPVHFFKSEVEGRHRPYARYANNGKDTIYVSVTDAHPRNYGNSIYYFEFRDGGYYQANGTWIKDLESDGPLLPSEAELVYQGTGNAGRGRHLSAEGAAWTSSIAIDGKGYPHMAYTVYKSNRDNRFRIASWDGTRWIDREVAFAGKCLYDREASYTGLIALDPKDPSVVVISSDVDPGTGVDSGGQHEIYRTRIGLEDNIHSIEWEPVTKNSPVRNLRPVIVREGPYRVILWNRGEFHTYIDYDLDTVGIVEVE